MGIKIGQGRARAASAQPLYGKSSNRVLLSGGDLILMALNLVEEDGDSPTMFGLGIVVFQTIVTEESWVICDQRAL